MPYGTKRQAGYGPLHMHPPWHPIALMLRGQPGTLQLRIFWQYKKPDLYTASSDRIDLLSSPCLTSGSINRLQGDVNPLARKHSYAITLRTPRQVTHRTRLDSVPSNNLTFVKEEGPIRN